MKSMNSDTIAAIATPPGYGGVGIVRVSGDKSREIAKHICGFYPQARHAHYTDFVDKHQQPIDQGLLIFFPNPHSFTGEDVLELQGHGGPVVLDILLKTVTDYGARLAQPGEFSERAFLNDKMDLSQAEAIADLIHASTEHAARGALRSLQGVFSKEVHSLVDKLTHLRMYIEAAIDFPEEEIDFLADEYVDNSLKNLKSDFLHLMKKTNEGSVIREGLHVVIAGRPNAGKSSLLNALSTKNSAIVTDIEGTTRDTLHEYIQIDGIPLHITDTAGLRDTQDCVEKEGIKRALTEVDKADFVLLVIDAQSEDVNNSIIYYKNLVKSHTHDTKLVIIHNKIDLLENTPPSIEQSDSFSHVYLSAKEGKGMDLLKKHLKHLAGFESVSENAFTARTRHIEALKGALHFLNHGISQLKDYGAGELLAEDLKYAQKELGKITGEISTDDLLGHIFSSFCIGK